MDLSKIESQYSESLAKHGPQAMGVGWRDHATHLLRFEKMSHVIEDADKPITVNDLGCGYGLMYDYLTEKGVPVGFYRGYDICMEMLGQAKRRLPEENVCWVQSAKIEQMADYGFACGIFNVRMDISEEAWRDHVLDTLANMNAFSGKGFSFNMLSTYVDFKEGHLYYGDPSFFFDHCKRNFSPRVSLLHDYPLYEWTIVVLK
jgi:SAM-dependent methyltransferase